MAIWKLAVTLALSLAVGLLLAALAWAVWLQQRDAAQLRRVWQALEASREAAPPRFEPAMLDGLPEVAQRYLRQAIAPGTPLQRVVTLDMQGEFLLGDQRLPMQARQILAPAARGFVWQAEMGRGLLRFAGSDGLLREADGRRESWTKFRLLGLLPVARLDGNADHQRAAATRALLEAVWAPASLLPQYGARWTPTGPNQAEVRFADLPELAPIQLTLDEKGRITELQALRWSDANPERVYRLQPFGGRVRAWATFGGFTLPAQLEMGNHFGRPEYQPFFFATVTSARY
ncbi:MAG: hypothetical protein L6Q75_18340 [Burkholderiaceae bacterium]|nr:hypothetical protein [Burkholderiaceae bacterium]